MYSCFLFLPVLCRRPAFLLFEQAGEIQRVVIPHGSGDVADRKVCPSEQGTGAPDAEVQEIFLW